MMRMEALGAILAATALSHFKSAPVGYQAYLVSFFCFPYIDLIIMHVISEYLAAGQLRHARIVRITDRADLKRLC